MTDNSSIQPGAPIPGEPLVANVPRVGMFEIDFSAEKYYYPAAAHRPVFQWIRVKNNGWSGEDEIVVSIFSEASGAQALIHPVMIAYPPMQSGETISVETVSVRPNFNELAQIEESLIGNLVVQVCVNEVVVAEKRNRFEFLAYNEWKHDPYDYDCLSAFVFPNHPVVVEIMDGVRKRLKNDTGDGATSGYQPFDATSIQNAKERNRQVLRAIFEELQSLDLEYSNPPESFEGHGQKIRTPDLAIRDRVVTCLDSTVLAASCIAAAGLKPLLFVVEGHAFPGVWSTPANMVKGQGRLGWERKSSAVISDIHEMQTLTSAGLIFSFESTQICRSMTTSFEAAENRHIDFANGVKASQFRAAIDVKRAGELGVRRLPNRSLLEGQHLYEIEIDRISYLEPDPIFEALIDHGPEESDDVEREKLPSDNMPRRVRRWMDALLDISDSSPLINLRTTTVSLLGGSERATRGINLPLVPGMLATLEDRLIAGESVRAVCAHTLPVDVLQNPTPDNVRRYFESSGCLPLREASDVLQTITRWQKEIEVDGLSTPGKKGQPPNIEMVSPQVALNAAQAQYQGRHEGEAARRFRTLKKIADNMEADSATNQLFLTIGTMVWNTQGEKGKSTEVRSPLFVVPVRISGSASNGFSITLDSSGDITPNYCLVEKLRSELGLHIPELETPDLDESGIDVARTISAIRRQLSESRYSTIRVDEEAQLAVLDFGTFRMWKDLQSNWQLFTKNPVVDHLINDSNETLVQTLTPFEGEALTPFSCDESQMEAVRWALEGKSFVLEGPPGTGKSQTIANLIAACLAEGKRLLFVAEKQVALEAVSTKLEEIGLDPFCITMHHESTTSDSIRQQLQVSLDFESIDVSRQWQSDSLVVQSLNDRLAKYRDAIVDENALGFNAIEAQHEVLRLGEGQSLEIDPQWFPLIGQHLAEIESALLQILGVVGSAVVESNPDWDLTTVTSMETFDRDLFARVVSQINDVMEQHKRLKPILEALLENDALSDVPRALIDAINLVADGKHLGVDVAQVVLAPEWASGIDNLIGQINSCKTMNSDVLSFFDVSAFRIDLSPQMAAASEAISAGIFKRSRKAEVLRNLLQPIAKASVEKEPSELLTLLQKVMPVRTQLDQLTASLLSVPHLVIRPDFDPFQAEHLDEIQSNVRDLQLRAQILTATEAAPVRALVMQGEMLHRSDVQIVELMLSSWGHVKNLIVASPESLTKWRQGRSLWDSLAKSVPIWMASAPQYSYLSKFSLIRNTLVPLYRGGLSQLAERILSGEQSLDDIHARFMRGLARSARHERLSTGPLGTFESQAFELALAQFTRQEAARRELMWKVIPRQLSEARPFQPKFRTGEIGRLEKELQRKVKRVSVSQLIKNYGEVITRLTPCFLMSPEAVSRLLPAESQFFDIVVFDEASQIRVAAAIPAMGRAKAAIIVGDSKQMPPTKGRGQTKTSTENDADGGLDDVSLDQESILSECRESNIPYLMLKCHFRSQHEGLIAFSNRRFYDSELVTFPAPNTDKTSPVSWFDVPDGEFLRSGEGRGTNPAEATAIVAEVIRRLEDPEHASKSIGVVTFNETQAELIATLLDEKAASHPALRRALNHPKKKERLFVIALERVQGDERDTIILSVSYSYKDDKRKVVSPQWGPLTWDGGERRLNVAITRAKQDLLVFCSFDPNHVSDGGATYKGVGLTKQFLVECRDAALSNGVALRAREVSTLDYHRRMLHDMLRNAGIQVRENVGLSKFRIDLAVTDPKNNSQFLSLLLDGEGWTQRSTSFDRDVLPNSVLRLIGWRRVGRVWLKDGVENPQTVLATVQNEIAREQSRHQLIELLEANGYEARSDARLSQVGVDIAIREAGQTLWPLAISLNGPGLFRQFFLYEGDVPPEHILREAQCVEGASVWLPDMQNSPEAVLQKLNDAFQRASELMSQLSLEVVPEISLASTDNEDTKDGPRQDESDAKLLQSPMRMDFVDSRSLPVVGVQQDLGPGPKENLALVLRAAMEIVELEGPIKEERLAKVLVARFGMSAVKTSRMESLRTLFARFPQSKSPFGTTYWSTTREHNLWRGFRTSVGEAVRSIDEVPAEEMVNTMVAAVAMGGSCFKEEIIRLTAEAFGRKAVTQALNTQLLPVLDWAVQQGRLVVDGDLYKLPE